MSLDNAVQEENTALMLAAANGHEVIAQALLAAGSDVHAINNVRAIWEITLPPCNVIFVQEGKSALMIAAENGLEAVVNALLKAGSDVFGRQVSVIL